MFHYYSSSGNKYSTGISLLFIAFGQCNHLQNKYTVIYGGERGHQNHGTKLCTCLKVSCTMYIITMNEYINIADIFLKVNLNINIQ